MLAGVRLAPQTLPRLQSVFREEDHRRGQRGFKKTKPNLSAISQ